MNDADRQRLASLYEHAYHQTHPHADLLGIPCANEQVVLQLLRCRIIPARFLPDEFDRWIQTIHLSQVEQIQRRIFERDRRWVQQQSRFHRAAFERLLHQRMGIGEHRGAAESRGEYVYGFAIDSQTLQYSLAAGYGAHHLALDDLLTKLFGPPAQWTDQRLQQIRARRTSLLGGLVITGVADLTTPILKILEPDTWRRDIRRVVRFILRHRLFIPIDTDCLPLRG